MTFQTLISGNWDLNPGHLTLNTILFFVLYPLSVNNKEDLSPSSVAFFCCSSCSVHTPVSITLACSRITEKYHNIFNGYLIFAMCEVQCLVQIFFFFLSLLFTCWFLQSQSMTYKDLPSITQLPLLLPIPVFSRFNTFYYLTLFILVSLKYN